MALTCSLSALVPYSRITITKNTKFMGVFWKCLVGVLEKSFIKGVVQPFWKVSIYPG